MPGRLFRMSLAFSKHLSAAVFAALFMIALPGGETLWIDEAATARLAAKPSFDDWKSEMIAGHASEHQMPLSMFLAWVGGKILGTSEWQLRAVNIVWGLAAVAALYLVGRKLRLPWLPLLLAVHPFFASYMNEARPYAMQIGTGAWLVFALVAFEKNRGAGSSWAAALGVAGFLLCGSSLLGVIPFGATLLMLVLLARQGRVRLTKPAWAWLALALLLLLPLAAFYIWTLTKHAGGARQWQPGLENVAFALYELAGFTGLGPGRVQLRAAALRSLAETARLAWPFLIALVALGSAYLVVARRLIAGRKEGPLHGVLGPLAGVVVFSVIAMAFLAWAVDWPFWGRHLAALLPFVVVLLAGGLQQAWQHDFRERLAAGALMVLLVASTLLQRFSPMHARDDYRSAASIARRAVADGEQIWWLADLSAASYYHVPLSSPQVVTAPDPATADLPDVVLLSKPDIYDRGAEVGRFLERRGFKVVRVLPAFQIWRRPPAR